MHHIVCLIALIATSIGTPALARWEPTRPVEIIVPAGTGGGLDQMARTIQGIVTKHNLMRQPLVVINKAGGAGGEGMLDVKQTRANPHKLMVAASNLFTTPLSTGIPFAWKDLTPVAMVALDEFVLWVNADTPYRTVRDFIAAARSGSLKFGGTGSKQEDQVLIAAIERAAGVKFIYIPFRGGGEVAVQLVGKHIDASVSNPIEAVAQWRGGQLRPLCIFDSSPVTYTERIADRAWSELPTCKSQGLDVEYTMLRGLFMSPGVSAEQVEFYVDLMRKVTATPEWRKLMQDGAFNPAFLTGPQFRTWLAHAEWQHYELMQSAGFATVAQPPSRPSGAPPQLGMPASPPAAAPAVVEPRPAPTPPPPAVAATPPPQIAVPQIATPQTAPAAPRADFGRRVALVIGNSAYQAVAPLPNPRRDAETVAAALRGVGFQNVTVATDLTREKLLAALLAFAREAERADWGLIYYAGHGIELGGANYLIPVDARLASDRDVELEAVSFNQALGAVERAGKLRLVLLDACRDNPFASQMRRTLATRSIGRGLASVEPEPGTLVVYAAKHGETALDGDGTNSPFVTALVQRLAVPGLEVRRLFDYVRDDVLALTRRRQQPFSYGSLPASLDFYFVQK